MNGIPIDPCGTDTADWVHDRIRAYNAQYITDCGELNFCVRGPDAAPLGGIAASRDLDCGTAWAPPCSAGWRKRDGARAPGAFC